ncbi:hypothetical protein AVDCRST_MAG94-3935, partial [uncultured Leptolyngbya sp.]
QLLPMIVNLQRLFARWQLSANLVARSGHFFGRCWIAV